ncbi:MAG: D-cysteine desulfhydrase family protein [Candidatus Thorarchaeota archaeon]|nr:D-cysteine desulfhydrase family protein [Candidatus Thorarchaeota archaeon]
MPPERLLEMLDRIPRVQLGFFPTPLHRAVNLGESLGLKELWMKRDDLTGVEFGGNKTRKLEFAVADALQNRCDTLVTVGAVQSNSCRQTAAAAAKYGLRCILLLAGQQPETLQGNLLLDTLLGAELKFYPDDDFMSLTQRLPTVIETLEELGLKPYALPAGVFTPLGSLGYVAAMKELREQMDKVGFYPERIVTATSTGGTLAGMIVGAKAYDIDAEIIAYSVLDDEATLSSRVLGMVSRIVKEYPGIVEPFEPNFTVDDRFLGAGYGVIEEGVKSAIRMFAKNEGVFLDPVYTAKSGLGLMRMALSGEVDRDTPVLYWHTGGQPALFAYASEL